MTEYYFFFFNDTATTEIYTLSLHDALPIPRGLLEGERDGVLHVGPALGLWLGDGPGPATRCASARVSPPLRPRAEELLEDVAEPAAVEVLDAHARPRLPALSAAVGAGLRPPERLERVGARPGPRRWPARTDAREAELVVILPLL